MPRFAPFVKWGRRFGEKEEYPYLSLDPKCRFLDKDNRCSIYRHRPAACRDYLCHRDESAMEVIDEFPTHKRLLSRLKYLPGQPGGMEA